MTLNIEVGDPETGTFEQLPQAIELVPYPWTAYESRAQPGAKTIGPFEVDWWCRNYSLVLDSTTTVDIHVAYGSVDQMISVIVKESEEFVLHVVAPVVGATIPALCLEFGVPKTGIRVNLVCVVSVAAD